MRFQLAINVKNLDEAVDFYSKAFGAELAKRRPGYANFAIENPPLKLVLFENPDATDRLNHMGVEVFDDEEVLGAAARFTEQGIEHEVQEEEVCCFANQNKVITYDPDGTMFEVYRVLGDSQTFFEEEAAAAVAVTAESGDQSERTSGAGCCAGTAS